MCRVAEAHNHREGWHNTTGGLLALVDVLRVAIEPSQVGRGGGLYATRACTKAATLAVVNGASTVPAVAAVTVCATVEASTPSSTSLAI